MRLFRFLAAALFLAACPEQNVTIVGPNPPPPPQPPPPQGNYVISVSPKAAACQVGDFVQFSAVVTVPQGQSNRVLWSSTSTAATVDSTGKVSCAAVGSAKIWAKLAAKPEVADTANVTVNAAPPAPASISLAPKDTSVFRTQSYQLRKTATGQSVASTCVSRNSQIATVTDSGTVTAVWPGTGNVAGVTWIVCSLVSDASKKDSVLVRVPLSRVTRLSVVPDSLVLKVGAQDSSLVNIEGDQGVSVNYICSSSNSSYVTATARGRYCVYGGFASTGKSYTPLTVRTIGLDANNQPVTKGVKVWVTP